MISQTTEYALRAVVWLASQPERPLTAQQIAECTRVPAGYLAKVLQGLSRAGLLHSQRGLGGGFTLARPASELTMWDVVQAVDPINRITKCPLGFEAHGNRLCSLHRELDEAIAAVQKRFSKCTLASLIEDTDDAGPLCAFAGKGRGRSKTTRRAKR